jgi:acyl-CoA synthetase (AMP-forming)/AMP-acid ligase II
MNHGPATVFDRVRDVATYAGHRVALDVIHPAAPDKRITYTELADLAARVAGALRTHDRLGPGDRVVLVLPNDESFVAALLGCAGAGMIAVPAPVPTARRPAAFRDRLRGIIADCAPSLLLTSVQWVAELAGLLSDSDLPEVESWESVRAGTPIVGDRPSTATCLLSRSLMMVDHTKAGCWLLPGGHVDDGEDPRKTVVREAQEELGTDVRFHERFGVRP